MAYLSVYRPEKGKRLMKIPKIKYHTIYKKLVLVGCLSNVAFTYYSFLNV